MLAEELIDDVGHVHRVGVSKLKDPDVGDLGGSVVQGLDDIGDEVHRLGRPANHDGVRLLVGGRHHVHVDAASALRAAILVVIAPPAVGPASHPHQHLEWSAGPATALPTPAAGLCLLLKDVVDQVGHTRGVRVDQAEHPDFRNAGHVRIQRHDDLHQASDVRGRIRDDEGIAVFIGLETGVFRQQGLQVVLEGGRRHVADGNDIGHHVVTGNYGVRVPTGEDGEVFLLGVLQRDDFQGLAGQDGGQALFFQDRVDQGDSFVQGDGLAADHRHPTIYNGLVGHDGQARGLGQVLQDGLQRRILKIELDLYLAIGLDRLDSGVSTALGGAPGHWRLGHSDNQDHAGCNHSINPHCDYLLHSTAPVAVSAAP